MAKEINLQLEMEKIQKALERNSNFSIHEREELARYAEMLLDKNQYMNLTAITEGNEFYVKHLIDSLSLLPILKTLEPGHKVLDIGSGAGLPGIPLKIMRKDLDFTLLDSLLKRLKFIDDVIRELKLTGIQTLHSRAEDAGADKEFREQFDVVTARAVASLPILLELGVPFMKIGGEFIAMKGSKDESSEAEKACKLLGVVLEEELQLDLPEGGGSRNLLRYRKVKMTPLNYPRKAGIPNKNPLI